MPLAIGWVGGYDDQSTKKFKWVTIIPQESPAGIDILNEIVERNFDRRAGKTVEDKLFTDRWELEGKTLTITRGILYGPAEVKGDPDAYGPYFKIRYKYASTYDPRFVASI